MIAVFGTKVFNVDSKKLHTFSDLTYDSTLETEKQEAKGKKPSTLIKGPGLNDMSFSIYLDVQLGMNPRSEFEDWEDIKDSEVAYPFVLGKKPLGTKWLVKNISMSEAIVDLFGNILSCKLALKFEEYERSGVEKAKKAKKAKKRKGTQSIDLDISKVQYGTTGKVARINPGMM